MTDGENLHGCISAVAQLKRDIIAERVKAGLRRARNNGKKLERPTKPLDVERVWHLRSRGLSHRAIARKLRVSHSTVGQILKNVS